MFSISRVCARGRFSVPCHRVKPAGNDHQQQRRFSCELKAHFCKCKPLKAYVAAPAVAFRVCVTIGRIDSKGVRSSRGLQSVSDPVAAAMTWACPRCTFLNQGKVAACSICSYDNPEPAVDSGPEWSCPSCTYLNPFVESVCDMCNAARPELEELERKEVQENGPRPTGKFRPLRACQKDKDEEEQVSVATDSPGATSTDLHAFLKPCDMVSRKRKMVDDEEGSKVSDMEGCTASKERSSAGDGEVSNSLLGTLHMERMARLNNLMKSNQQKSVQESGTTSAERRAGESAVPSSTMSRTDSVVVLSYNVWFREDLEVLKRMNAIGNIILQHQPHVICFQEVTANIYNIFQRSSWWKLYECSVPPDLIYKRAYFCMQMSRLRVANFHRNPFRNSIMGRELCMADLDDGQGDQLVVATSHLESPCPAPPSWNQMYSKERVTQANEALQLMKDLPNVVFGGDMNWNDKTDGTPPLPEGWFDAWLKLHPIQPGLTYDGKANAMLTGTRLQQRLDRFFCHLQNFNVESIEMVGTQPIPGLTYEKEKKVKKEVQMITLPVYPSDHFGLLLKLRRR